MPTKLYLEGISIEELETLIRKVVEEVWNNSIEEHKLSPKKLNNQLLEKELLTRKETAALLRISLVTLYNWTNQGRLTSYSIGTKIRYKADEVNNALTEIKTTKYQRK